MKKEEFLEKWGYKTAKGCGQALFDFKAELEKDLLLAFGVPLTKKTGSERKLGDYDVWYKPCEKCGFDTGKSTVPKDSNKRCWKCGEPIYRDYSDRALKVKQTT